MALLLPYRYKKIGALIAPAGLSIWLLMQGGYIRRFAMRILHTADSSYYQSPAYFVNVGAAVAGFFLFLTGLYFISFSKEKIEDEMVRQTRLDSFQFAAALQLLIIIGGFLTMLALGDPGQGNMMLFFLLLIVVFWLAFIGRFNYILHVKYRP